MKLKVYVNRANISLAATIPDFNEMVSRRKP